MMLGARISDNQPAPEPVTVRRISSERRIELAHSLSRDKESDKFHDICMKAFQNADKNGDGILDRDEFMQVLRSPSLNLQLTDEQVKETVCSPELLDSFRGMHYRRIKSTKAQT